MDLWGWFIMVAGIIGILAVVAQVMIDHRE